MLADQIKYQADILSSIGIDNEITNRLILLVYSPEVLQTVSVWNKAAAKVTFVNHLLLPCFDTERGFLALAAGLPIPYVIGQLIYMSFELLLTLIDTPYFDIMLDEPFDDEGRFVIASSQSVKHKHEQDIKTLKECLFFEFLYSISIIRAYLVSGNTPLVKLANDHPAVSFGILTACNSLQRNIIMIDLSDCRNTIETINPFHI